MTDTLIGRVVETMFGPYYVSGPTGLTNPAGETIWLVRDPRGYWLKWTRRDVEDFVRHN